MSENRIEKLASWLGVSIEDAKVLEVLAEHYIGRGMSIGDACGKALKTLEDDSREIDYILMGKISGLRESMILDIKDMFQLYADSINPSFLRRDQADVIEEIEEMVNDLQKEVSNLKKN